MKATIATILALAATASAQSIWRQPIRPPDTFSTPVPVIAPAVSQSTGVGVGHSQAIGNADFHFRVTGSSAAGLVVIAWTPMSDHRVRIDLARVLPGFGCGIMRGFNPCAYTSVAPVSYSGQLATVRLPIPNDPALRNFFVVGHAIALGREVVAGDEASVSPY